MRLSRAALTRDVHPPKLLPRRPILLRVERRVFEDQRRTASRLASLPVSVVSSILPSLSPQPVIIEPAARHSAGREGIGEGDVLGALLRAYQAVREDDARAFPVPLRVR